MRGSIRWVGDALLVVVKRADGRECLRRYSWTHWGNRISTRSTSPRRAVALEASTVARKLGRGARPPPRQRDGCGSNRRGRAAGALARSVARDGRVEYAAPSLGCLVNDIPGTNGRRQLVCRFGGLDVASGVGAKATADDEPDAPSRLADGPTSGLVHGLFVLDRDATRWENIDIDGHDFGSGCTILPAFNQK